MVDFFARRGAAYVNEMKRSMGALLGIAQGLICDGRLSDEEIRFLNDWLKVNEAIALEWPGEVIHKKVRTVLADNVVTEPERAHLVGTLQHLIGGSFEDLAAAAHVTELAFDEATSVEFPGKRFCLTGEFVFGPRETCASRTEKLGGVVIGGVTKALQYLVVGALGSVEWKHGSFGTKIDKAVRYKRDGVPILIVHEEQWKKALGG